MTRSDAIRFLFTNPVGLGKMLGFNKLTELHNDWITDMISGHEDKTLQAHRGSYKTTCVSIALAIIMVCKPNKKIMFMRKTDSDVREIVLQVKKILESPQMKALAFHIWGIDLRLTTANANELSTNLSNDPRGTSQLVALGINGSLTGKHFDLIFTDDIVNLQDRVSTAERKHTKQIYQELQNIKNRGGRIYNTGTPWHKEDAFCLMPNPEVWDCYTTGLIDDETLAYIKSHMESSLFAANYELKHIASDDVLFVYTNNMEEVQMAEQGICHIDAAYGGSDFTAFTICHKVDGKYFVFGKLWRKHIDDCIDEVIKHRTRLNAGKIYCEDNGDKGYLARDLRDRGERVSKYHENQNKFIKITSYLKRVWDDVYFVEGTDQAYIEQVCDFNENAEHDDAPDSLASVVRILWNKNNKATTDTGQFNMFL